MTPMQFENYHGHKERVVGVEYHAHQGLMLPFSVFTTDFGKPSRWMAGIYDFQWCKRNELLYYHCSGGGGRFYINQFCFPTKSRAALWWDRAIVFPTNGSNSSNRRLSDKTVTRFGYAILADPIILPDGQPNPFTFANHGSVEYCPKCDDYLPSEWTDAPCKHLWWCEKCGGWSKPGERCNHRRQ